MYDINDFSSCISSFFTKHLAGIRNLSQNTIKAYRDTFCLFLLFFQQVKKKNPEKVFLSDIDKDTVLSFLDWLECERHNSIATRNARLAAIHAFVKYAQMYHPERLLQFQQILEIPIKEAPKPFVNYLPEEVLKELLSLPNQKERYGIRDAAMLCILYDSGARVQELIDLKIADLRLDTLPTVRLLGKGRKVRIVPLMKPTAQLLKRYLEVWNIRSELMPDYPLFVNHQGNQLSRSGVTYVLQKYMAQTSWQKSNKATTPHVLRHSKAMHLLRADVDLHYIRDFLGHVDIETTEVYARADSEMKRRALIKANIDMPTADKTSWQKDKDLLAWLQSL